MTEDYLNPQKLENELKIKNTRRIGWIKRKWNTSKSANLYLNLDGNNVGIFIDENSGKYKCRIDKLFGS